MKHVIVAILVSQMFCLSSLSYAQEAVYLEKGERTPFNGLLLSKESQAKLLAEQEKEKKQCVLDKNLLSMRAEEKCKHSLNLKKIEQEALQRKLDALLKIKNDEIKRLQELALKNDSSFHRNLWFVGGVLVGVGLMVGGAFLVKEIN